MAEAKETMSGWNFKPSQNYGTDHKSYFEEYKMQLAENKAPTDEAPKFRVDVQGISVAEDVLPKAVQGVAELARKYGFSTEYRYSRTWEEGAVFKSGARAGEKRPDKAVNHWAMRLLHPQSKRGAILTWAETALGTAMTNDGATMTPIANVTALKAWIKKEYDVE